MGNPCKRRLRAECEHSCTNNREIFQMKHRYAPLDIENDQQGLNNAGCPLVPTPNLDATDSCLLEADLLEVFCICRGDRTSLQNSQCVPDFAQILPYGMSPTRGIKIGEASHPGPQMPEQTVTLAFFNPTTIWGKETVIEQMPAQIWLAAETAANANVQNAMTARFRSKHIRTVWSKPTLSRDEPLTETEGVRGKASGTVILSRFPARPARHTIEIPEEFATRLSSAVIQVHQMQIHCIAMYGFCSSQPKARARTDRMLQFAAKLMDDVALPTILAGDFNHELSKLEGFQYFLERGFQSTSLLYKGLHDAQMPATYKQSTSNDQFLMPPQLLSYVKRIEVRMHGEFAGHHPVMVTLSLPSKPLLKQVLRVPKPFHHFGIEKMSLPCNMKNSHPGRLKVFQMKIHLPKALQDGLKGLKKRCMEPFKKSTNRIHYDSHKDACHQPIKVGAKSKLPSSNLGWEQWSKPGMDITHLFKKP